MDEQERFRAIFRSSYPLLHRFARNRGLAGADADDLVAATFEVAWRRLDDVPLDDPTPWLFAVARNLWRNKRRSDLRALNLLGRLELGAVPIDAVGSATDPDIQAIRAALGRLGENDRDLLVLIAWDGLTPSQAAAVLGCSPVAARTRLHRARRRLASLLGSTSRVPRARPSGQMRAVPALLTTEAGDD